jgi:hypothetical protein
VEAPNYSQAWPDPQDADELKWRSYSIADAYAPQAMVSSAGILVFFRRFSVEICPYWHSDIPAVGDLYAVTLAEAPINLSKNLGVGPVLDFALTNGENPRVFALREQPLGTELIVLEGKGAQWLQVGTVTLDGDFRQIRAEVKGPKAQLVLAERNDPADITSATTRHHWTLHYLTWPLPKQDRP